MTQTTQGRGDERVKLHRQARLVVVADCEQPPIKVTLEDISFGGAGIVSPVYVKPRTRTTLMIQSTTPRSLLGHVVNCKAIEHDQFRLSMQFDVSAGPTIERIRYAFFPDDALSE